MTRDSAPKWRRRKEARPAEIVSAAYAVFAEKGFAAARLDDIAARAGVSKGALYLYFSTKEDLFAAVVRDAVAPDFDRIEQAVAALDADFATQVRTLLPRLAHLATASPIGKVVKLVIGESGNFPELARIWHDTLITRGIGVFSGVIERAQARGEVRAGDPRNLTVSLIAPLLLGVLFRETFVPVGGRSFDIPDLMSQHVEIVLNGLLLDGDAR